VKDGERERASGSTGRPPREKPATSLTGGTGQRWNRAGSAGERKYAGERERERERAKAPDDGRRTTAEIEAGDVTDRRDWAALESSGKRRREEICRREGERERAEAPDDGRRKRRTTDDAPRRNFRSVRAERFQRERGLGAK